MGWGWPDPAHSRPSRHAHPVSGSASQARSDLIPTPAMRPQPTRSFRKVVGEGGDCTSQPVPKATPLSFKHLCSAPSPLQMPSSPSAASPRPPQGASPASCPSGATGLCDSGSQLLGELSHAALLTGRLLLGAQCLGGRGGGGCWDTNPVCPACPWSPRAPQ